MAYRVEGESMAGLLSEPRRRRILEWIEEEGSARVRDLSAAFEVSEATIRQDLERLEKDGHITREHGGAFLNSVPAQVHGFSLHHQVNMEAKRKIGALAASQVKDGETIILDAGTTTTEIANRLIDRQNITVITNSLNIAMVLGAVPSFAVHMPGGQFKAPTLSLSGDKSVEYFRNIFCRKAVSGDGRRCRRCRPHLSELCRPAAQGGDDQPPRAGSISSPIPPRSTAPHSPGLGRSSSFTPSSPTTAFQTRTPRNSSCAISRS